MFIVLKVILAIGIIACSMRIGILISQKYKFRLNELDELRDFLTTFVELLTNR